MIFKSKNKGLLIASILTIILYFFFAYKLERTEFSHILLLYISLFIAFYFILKHGDKNIKILTGLAILFRLIFLFATPNLSQDFYRFIWDGRMLLNCLNPYLSLPETFINLQQVPIPQAAEIYAGMGELNGSHYTNYPPLNQLCFLIAALFANKSILGSVIVLRLIIILADIGIIYFGKKILEKLNLPIHYIFLYALNPFIIIELTGNLHFEPVMLFFLIWSIYLLLNNRLILAGILFACSISVKLIPLLFLPLFYQWFIKRPLDSSRDKKVMSVRDCHIERSRNTKTNKLLKLLLFYIIIIGTTILFFLPFYNEELLNNYMNSVGLWFRNFEFNASLYYLFREIGYLFRGYNEIATIGKIIPVLTILFLGFITFFRKNTHPKELITALLFGLSFYYFTTTTMHPWYLATLILLCVFTKYRFPIVWSVVIILSYQSYANLPWKENLWVISLEYLILYGYLIFEIIKKNKPVLVK
ncbi:mannosyltransferase [uncultured Polaribacter sp.]|uniref:mannosyltransferase n=1 Tax=uncultured Polaribacter sp. TaxID=174711 RepID=UPI002606C07B|nr:mannosyltransferase [uncultured Polaribacter sp.]